jgi:hypothetical protein
MQQVAEPAPRENFFFSARSVYHNVQDKALLALLRLDLTNKGGVYATVHN